jgi:hypothetical protein
MPETISTEAKGKVLCDLRDRTASLARETVQQPSDKEALRVVFNEAIYFPQEERVAVVAAFLNDQNRAEQVVDIVLEIGNQENRAGHAILRLEDKPSPLCVDTPRCEGIFPVRVKADEATMRAMFFVVDDAAFRPVNRPLDLGLIASCTVHLSTLRSGTISKKAELSHVKRLTPQ